MSSIHTPCLIVGTIYGKWHSLAKSLVRCHSCDAGADFEEWHTGWNNAYGPDSSHFSSLGKAQEWLATPLGTRAEKLIKKIFAADTRCVLWSPHAAFTLRWWLEKIPGARAVVFCEAPATTLSCALRDAPLDSKLAPSALVDAWEAAAIALLECRRLHRERVFFVDMAECRECPGALEAWMHGCGFDGFHAEAPLAGGETLTAIAMDALCARFVQERVGARRTWQEIQASCQPLDAQWQPVNTEENLSAALSALVENARSLSRLGSRISDLETENSSLIEKHDLLLRERDQLADERVALERRSLETSEMLLKEIEAAFRESEDFYEKLLAEEDKSGHLGRELDSARGEIKRLDRDLEQGRKVAENLGRRIRFLEGAKGRTSLSMETISIVHIHEGETHKHADFLFEGVQLASTRWPALRFRIVQHFEHAGVLLFQPEDPGSESPLHSWQPNGAEDGLPFLLLLPHEESCMDFLTRLPGRDIFLLRELLLAALGHMNAFGFPNGAESDWESIGREALQEIHELPERLHYDCLDAVPDDERAPKSIYFDVYNVYYRGRLIPDLGFRWNLDQEVIEIAHTTDTTGLCLLTKWPSRHPATGKPCDLRLDFSPDGEAATAGLWRALIGVDREFVRLLVLELRNFSHHYIEKLPGRSGQLPALHAQAHRVERNIESWDAGSLAPTAHRGLARAA